jgi:thioredoxin reductase (NADPH)
LLARRLFAGGERRAERLADVKENDGKENNGKENDGPLAQVPKGNNVSKGKLFTKPKLMDYSLIPTTVFTPIEYGCVGLSEEEAIDKHNDTLKIFHAYFQPLEWNLNMNRSQQGYIKVICKSSEPNLGNSNLSPENLHVSPENLSPERNLSPENLQVIGIHILGQNAGEIIQGLAVAMRTGHLTKAVLDDTMGIHPTSAEDITMVETEKIEGVELKPKTGC